MTGEQSTSAGGVDVCARSAAELLHLACSITDSEARKAFRALSWDNPKLGRTPPKTLRQNFCFPGDDPDWSSLTARGLARPEHGNHRATQLTDLGIAVMRLAWHARAAT